MEPANGDPGVLIEGAARQVRQRAIVAGGEATADEFPPLMARYVGEKVRLKRDQAEIRARPER